MNVDHIYIYISMHMQNFIEICRFVVKIFGKKAFWTWIKGHNYVVSENYPTCNSIPLLSNTNIYAMHMQNFIEIRLFILNDQKCILDINQGPYLCCFWMKLSHLQSHTTPLWYQCLCKVWRKSIKRYWSQSTETKRWQMDRQTDVLTDRHLSG